MKHPWLADRYETEISHGTVSWQTRWARNGIGLLASSIGEAVRFTISNCRFLNIWRTQGQLAAAHNCLIAWPATLFTLAPGALPNWPPDFWIRWHDENRTRRVPNHFLCDAPD